MFKNSLTKNVCTVIIAYKERIFAGGADVLKKRYVLKNRFRFYTITLTAVLIIIAVVFSTAAYGGKEKAYRTIIVREGETLWDIAVKNREETEIRKYIFNIKKLNKLEEGKIFTGMELRIPQS